MAAGEQRPRATADRRARVTGARQDPAVDASLLVVVDDPLVVGMLLMELGRPGPDSPYGHVSMVFVDPDRWGLGVGCMLLDEASAVASERGWLSLSLWTRTSNAQAQRLYAKNGFRDTGEMTRLHNGDGIGRWRLSVERGSKE